MPSKPERDYRLQIFWICSTQQPANRAWVIWLVQGRGQFYEGKDRRIRKKSASFSPFLLSHILHRVDDGSFSALPHRQDIKGGEGGGGGKKGIIQDPAGPQIISTPAVPGRADGHPRARRCSDRWKRHYKLGTWRSTKCFRVSATHCRSGRPSRYQYIKWYYPGTPF